MKQVMILGGYGAFGQRISRSLAQAGIAIIIAGRREKPARTLLDAIKTTYPKANVAIATFDVQHTLTAALIRFSPTVVINTCGPFQLNDYTIATQCIQQHINYIDLADARQYVSEFHQLDQKAKKAGVMLITGASTVPGLSSAVLEHYQKTFKTIIKLTYGISPGARSPRGLATTQSILTYLGRPISPASTQTPRYGWQDIYRQDYPLLGKRWMGNCDIPDLTLFPKHYHIQDIKFSAGMENSWLHLSIWFLSWLKRLGLPLNLVKHAKWLLKLSKPLDYFGTDNGGMHMIIDGIDHHNRPRTLKWFIIAKNGDGPQIPCIPAIVLAQNMLNGKKLPSGAYPCVGLLSLDIYLAQLQDFDIQVFCEEIAN